MEELKKVIINELNEFDFKTLFREEIKKHIEDTVKKSIKESFSWGSASKTIKKTLEENMRLPKNLDLPSYRAVLLEEFTAGVQAVLNHKSSDVKKMIMKKLHIYKDESIPKEIDWDTFVENVKDIWAEGYEDDEIHDSYYDDETLKFEVKEKDSGWHDIKVFIRNDLEGCMSVEVKEGLCCFHSHYFEGSLRGIGEYMAKLAFFDVKFTDEPTDEEFTIDTLRDC